MHFVVIGRDEPSGQARKQMRADHLAFVQDRQTDIVYAGPLIEDGRMVGSLFVFDLPDRSALDAYMAEDPYFRGQVFERIEIFESRWMVPERVPGTIAAEIEKALRG